MSDLKRTPLFPVYGPLGGRLVDFGGWELPVQYAGIKAEHLATRSAAGIFDVSHMGEIRVKGPGALSFLQRVTCNDVARLRDGQSQYSGLLNPEGGFIDDLFIYRLAENHYFLCVNASNSDADHAWLSSQPHPDCAVENESPAWAQIAVQGPNAVGIVNDLAGGALSDVPRLCIKSAPLAGVETMCARTGYTGEDGFEIFIPAASGVKVWDALMAAGKPRGMVPVGLGARDTLRLEMGMPLHGHDISPTITPVEADLNWIVAMGKGDFVGRAALERQQREGVSRKRVGLVMVDAGIPRDHMKVFAPHGEGMVTSGTKTPSVEAAIAMAYVPTADAANGTEVEVEIRGARKKAKVQKWPFYRPGKR